MVSQRGVDFVAAFVHTVTAVIIGIIAGKGAGSAVSIVIAVEVIAALFHMAYVYKNNNNSNSVQPRNQFKWVEYGITASMGAVAVAYTGENNFGGGWVALVVIMGSLQQLCGAVIEKYIPRKTDLVQKWVVAGAFLAAVALQIAEAVVVKRAEPPEIVFWPYIVFYASFGAVAAIEVWWADAMPNDPGEEAIEMAYTALGTVTKVIVAVLVTLED